MCLENCKAVSVNGMYQGTGRRKRKTQKYKYLEQVARFECLKNNRKIKSFLKDFDPFTQSLEVTVINELSDLVVKKSQDKERIGRISETCLDTDNSLKSVIDSIFPFLGYNDCESIAVKGYKFQSEKNNNNIYVIIKILNTREEWQRLQTYLRLNTQIKP